MNASIQFTTEQFDSITAAALRARTLAKVALANSDQGNAEGCAILELLLESVQTVERVVRGVA